MKKLFLIMLMLPGIRLMSQNVGIGTTDPRSKLHAVGGILINAPNFSTNTPPTPAQTKILINSGTTVIPFTDSTVRLYDPGGPAGNYVSNLFATAILEDGLSSAIGTEVTLESVQLGTGDSLIIKETSTSPPFLAVGNNYTVTGKWIFNSPQLYIIFKSNADASNGSGFSVLLRRVYDNSSSLSDISSFAGSALLFEPKKNAFRAGTISTAIMGYSSVAIGDLCSASGDYAVALGNGSIASGDIAVALGNGAIASGSTSLAMGGSSTEASGQYSLAFGFVVEASNTTAVSIGNNTTASGISSLALGRFNTASGDYSTAMGSRVSTNGQEGSFMIGDASTNIIMNSPAANNFRARFANGYRLYTSADYSTSCSLGAGDNAWTTSSDVRLKENFVPVDGEAILKKIALIPLTTWNYKSQDPLKFRHYGPMAQDFHAAFGRDIYGTIGSDTTINQADFDGVNFIAIQALEKRNTQLQNTIELLLKKIEQLETIQLRQEKEIKTIKRKRP